MACAGFLGVIARPRPHRASSGVRRPAPSSGALAQCPGCPTGRLPLGRLTCDQSSSCIRLPPTAHTSFARLHAWPLLCKVQCADCTCYIFIIRKVRIHIR